MSAYLSRVFADRVEVLVDSAMLDPVHHAVSFLAPKVVAAPNLPIAVCGRGEASALGFFGGKLVEIAAGCATVDEAVERFSDFVAGQSGTAGVIPLDLLLAGWSETHGGFHVHAVDDAGASVFGTEPWRFRDVPSFWSGGPFDDEDFADANFFVDEFDQGLAYQGRKLMQAFRKKPVFREGDDTPIYGIGGQLVMVTITPGGWNMRALGAWPDYLGEPIDPTAPFHPRIGA